MQSNLVAFCSTWTNCSASVDPFIAVVDAFPPEAIVSTRSKYSVPTSLWWLTAVYPSL
ncbi:hypothetical protein SUSAZ_10065 [Sulfolobus acidocaldarius SUSAZ]|nr:hypothetical protein SUSAZ_10065 [Sulfolobus acidocaldarius SUSAZ]